MRRIWNDPHPIEVTQGIGDRQGMIPVALHSWETGPDGGQSRGGVGPHGEQGPAVTETPFPGLGNEVLGAGQARPGQGPQVLVERDIDAVEQPGDLLQRSVVGGWALPETGAVEMDRRPTVTSPRGLGEEILPIWELPPYFPLGQLEQQGAQGFGYHLQALESEGAVGITNRATDEVMETFEGASLMHFHVAGGVKRDRPTIATVGVNAQGDLLGHGPADEEGSGRHPEEIGEVGLELLDHAAVAVAIGGDVGG